MSDCCHGTDNWEELERGYRAMLPADVLAFIDANRAKEHSESMLIATLHMVQGHFGHLGPGHLEAVAQLMQVPLAKVTGVATFYHYFRLQPRGRYLINVCLGTACYVKGAEKVAQKLTEELGIHFGETSKDGIFSLESTRCVGTCGLAPVVMIGDEVHGPLSPSQIPTLLEGYLARAAEDMMANSASEPK
ncbi:MAG: NADH-quinone oxidoreductase subunit NuoE [Acidobacteria bacterium]|nr:NADH-quinone oxidoreductase subunit NuoE [Acidobacteriota bacterium]MBI3488335.1 NADH-quinone oxidoreductase subunit NuoE [Acidobacteriota bacterium]